MPSLGRPGARAVGLRSARLVRPRSKDILHQVFPGGQVRLEVVVMGGRRWGHVGHSRPFQAAPGVSGDSISQWSSQARRSVGGVSRFRGVDRFALPKGDLRAPCAARVDNGRAMRRAGAMAGNAGRCRLGGLVKPNALANAHRSSAPPTPRPPSSCACDRISALRVSADAQSSPGRRVTGLRCVEAPDHAAGRLVLQISPNQLTSTARLGVGTFPLRGGCHCRPVPRSMTRGPPIAFSGCS